MKPKGHVMYGPYAPKLAGYDDETTLTNGEVASLFGWTVPMLQRFYLNNFHGFPTPGKQGRKRLHSVGRLRVWAKSYDADQGWKF